MRSHFSRAAAGNSGGGVSYNFTHSAFLKAGTFSLGSFAFTNCGLGIESSSRIIAVAVASYHGQGGVIGSVSIGGVATTLVSNPNALHNTCIGYLSLPSGTLATINVQTGTGTRIASIFVYSIYGASGLEDADVVVNGTTNTLSTSPGAAVIALASSTNNSVPFAWSGGPVVDSFQAGSWDRTRYMSSQSASMYATQSTTNITAINNTYLLASASFI